MIKMSELAPATGALLAALVREIVRSRRGVRRERRRRRRARVLRAAVRPPAVHRLDGGRARGDARRRREPHPGHARARRQVPGDRRARLSARRGRRADHGRQADERRADVHRARLRAGAGRRMPTRSSKRRGASSRPAGRIRCVRPDYTVDRQRPPLRPADRLPRRGARARRGDRHARRRSGAGPRHAPDSADDRAGCPRRRPPDAGGDLRADPAGGAVPRLRRGARATSTRGRGRSRSTTSTATSAGSRAC